MARALIVALAVLWVPSALSSDAIVITRAMLASTVSEIFVHEDSVVVELEIELEDMMHRHLEQVIQQMGTTS